MFWPIFDALLLCVIAQGCSSVLPFQEKKTAKTETPQSIESLFTVPGPVVSLEISPSERHLAVTYHPLTTENDSLPFSEKTPWKQSLWNIEFQSCYLEAEKELNEVDSVFSSSFDSSGNLLFVADKDELRAKNSKGQIKSNVRSFSLYPKVLPGKISWLDESYDGQKIRLSRHGGWISCQDRDGSWKLIDRTEPERVVTFPELDSSEGDKANANQSAESLAGSNPDSNAESTAEQDSLPESQAESEENLETSVPLNEKDSEEAEFRVSEILAFSPSNDLVATLITDQPFDASSEALPEETAREPHPSLLTSLQQKRWLPGGHPQNDEKMLDSDSNNYVFQTIVIWDLHVAKTIELAKAKRPLEAIEICRINVQDGVDQRKCDFSSDGLLLAVRSKSKYVGIWNTTNGRLFSELGEHQQKICSLAFSPKTLKMVVGTGGEEGHLVLWDVRKGLPQRVYQEDSPNIKKITALAFSPDGNFIYYGTQNGEVKRWDIHFLKEEEVSVDF